MSRIAMHKTKDGKEIPISQMDNDHLINTIKRMHRNMDTGIVVRYGGSSFGECYYDEDMLDGYELAERFGYRDYVEELVKRMEHNNNEFKD